MQTVTVNIPTSLNDITLSQFQRVIQLSQETDFDIKSRAYCSIIYKLPGTIVDQAPRKALHDLVGKVDELLNSSPDFVNRFTLHGVEYGFIPDLDRITAGEWVDLETCGFAPENLHKLMAILFRPITEKRGEKYLIEPYKAGEHELFKEAPAGVIIGALLFFYRIALDCTTATPNLIEKTTKRQNRGEDLGKSGGGIQS